MTMSVARDPSDKGFLDQGQQKPATIRAVCPEAALSRIIVSTAFISPYRSDRDRVRSIVEDGDMVEIFVKCPLEICEQRDPKMLYKKARAGEIKEFTGISAPYEEPERPELIIDSGRHSVEECADMILHHLTTNRYVY